MWMVRCVRHAIRRRDKRFRFGGADKARRARWLEEIKVCVGYKLDGEKLDSLPSVSEEMRRVKPVYETLAGWKSPTVGVTGLETTSTHTREYVQLPFRTKSECTTGPEEMFHKTIVHK